MPPKVEAAPPQADPVQAADDAPVVEAQPAPEAVVEPGQVEAPAAPVEPATPAPKTFTEEELAAAQEEGRRKGQAYARSEISTLKKNWEAEQRDRAVFDHYSGLSTEDPDTYARDMVANPDLRQSYERGHALRARPSPEAVEQFKVPWMTELIGPFIAQLQEVPELKDVPRDELGNIKLETRPHSLDEHGVVLFKLAVKKGVEAGIVKERQKIETDARKAERSRVLAEVGLEPEQIEGLGVGSLPSVAAVAAMSVEEYGALPAETRKKLMSRDAGRVKADSLF